MKIFINLFYAPLLIFVSGIVGVCYYESTSLCSRLATGLKPLSAYNYKLK